MKRLQGIAAFVLLAASGAAFAQRQPAGTFDWEGRAGTAALRSEYVFEGNGIYRFVIRTANRPITYEGRWEQRRGDVVLHVQDGGEQTYRWKGADLLLVAASHGMPDQPVVLKHRDPPKGNAP